jgi:hypothetical protein
VQRGAHPEQRELKPNDYIGRILETITRLLHSDFHHGRLEVSVQTLETVKRIAK